MCKKVSKDVGTPILCIYFEFCQSLCLTWHAYLVRDRYICTLHIRIVLVLKPYFGQIIVYEQRKPTSKINKENSFTIILLHIVHVAATSTVVIYFWITWHKKNLLKSVELDLSQKNEKC